MEHVFMHETDQSHSYDETVNVVRGMIGGVLLSVAVFWLPVLYLTVHQTT